MAKRGRPPYAVPPLPEGEEAALRETVGEVIRKTIERDGKQAYQFHPLQIVAVLQSECYRMMDEWREKGEEDWQRFFRQAGDRCGTILPETPKTTESGFLKPAEIWPTESENDESQTKVS